jgi:hypothetical protein
MSQIGSLTTVSLLGAVDSLTGNSGGVVLPDGGGNINVVGGNNITTVGNALPNTLTINVSGTTNHAVQVGNATASLTSLAVGTNGQVLIGATGADPAFATLTSAGGTITFTPGVNSLNLEAVASMGGTFDADIGTATPEGGILNVIGGAIGLATINITTIASGNTVNIALKDDVYLLGFLFAEEAIGTLKNFNMVTTTAEDTGTIIQDGNAFIHTFGTSNIFMGLEAGNFTLSGTQNIGIGVTSLNALTNGSNNVAVGFETMTSTNNSDSTAVGSQAMKDYIGSNCVAVGSDALKTGLGDFNIAIGRNAGTSVAGNSNIFIGNAGANESHTIRIGNNGGGSDQQNKCFVAGISGITPGVANPLPVIIDSAGQLGTFSTTNHAVQVGNSAGSFTSLTVGTNGQVLIGATGADPAFATLTSTGGTVSFTTGVNSLNLEVAGGGGTIWNEVTGTSASMAINNSYIANNAGLVTLTLPAVAALGSIIKVTGKGAGGWRIAQNAGQTIFFGTSTTTTGAAGRLDSTATRDTVELVCVTANNDWNVLSSIGNITVT